jgi:hypothetical protein
MAASDVAERISSGSSAAAPYYWCAPVWLIRTNQNETLRQINLPINQPMEEEVVLREIQKSFVFHEIIY